jgi:hypothetical protein
MSQGSLENHLFRRSLPLPWSIRVKIALGAAKRLAKCVLDSILQALFFNKKRKQTYNFNFN